MYSNYQTAITEALTDLFNRVVAFLPNIIVAIIVLLVGWILGFFLGDVLRRALEAIGIDQLGARLGLQQLSERSGRQIRISRIVQWVIKWFFILASIIAAADILGMDQITQFFYQDVLGYASHVVVAMAILLLGILAANFLSDIIEGTVRTGGFSAARALGSITKWSIVVFAVIAALSELQIAQSFLQDLFRAVIAMAAIAGGLAFGLGGRDHAKKMLDYIESGITRRN